MKKKPLLICMMGLPRSGKSTLSKEISALNSAPIVEPDAIRTVLLGQPYRAEVEPFVWATAYTMVRALFESGHQCVVVDATNYHRKRRDTWQSDKWDTEFYVVSTSREECLRRCMAQGPETRPEILAGVINDMADNWEPLHEDEVWRNGL